MFKVFTLFFLVFCFSFEAFGGASEIFTFENSFSCNERYPHHSFCTAADFKEWSDTDKNEVKGWIDSLPKEKLASFFNQIKEHGILKFHRVNHSTVWRPNHRERRVEFSRDVSSKAIVWVSPVTKVIGFTDGFFKNNNVKDPYTGLDRKQLVILHELAHVFDLSGDYSSQDSFLDLLKWSYKDGAWSPKGVSSYYIKDSFSLILETVKNEGLEKGYALDRKFGLEHGYPTLYAMTSFQESFAELLAYSILDPYAGEYMSKGVVSYFERLVTKPLDF